MNQKLWKTIKVQETKAYSPQRAAGEIPMSTLWIIVQGYSTPVVIKKAKFQLRKQILQANVKKTGLLWKMSTVFSEIHILKL